MVNTVFYDEMQKIAQDVLGEFGQAGLQYVAVTPGTGPKDNPGPPSEVTYPIDAAARGVKFKYVDGTTIKASDLQCTMSVVPDAPALTLDGFVIAGGLRHKIVRVDTIPPTGTPVAHRLFFRR